MKVHIVHGMGQIYGVYMSFKDATRELKRVRKGIDMSGSHESYRYVITSRGVIRP